MRYYISLLVTIFTVGFLMAQAPSQEGIINPVEWSGSVKKISDSEYDLIFHAVIEKDWHIYSQFTPEGGPIPMLVKFTSPEKGFDKIEGVKESETHTAFNDLFGVDEKFFSETATLTQKIKVTNDDVSIIKSILNYQVCKEVCIQQEFYFVFDLNAQSAKVFTNYDEFEAYGQMPEKTTKKENANEKETVVKQGANLEKKQEHKGLWNIFFLAFFGGFAALLMPCIFPMIPMTVGFFTKQSKNRSQGIRNALLYGFFIVLIYVLLGTIVTAIFGADALNALSTNVTFNIIFFLMLIVFAASFLGAFEIMLPNSWANKVDNKANKGGILGIFFMALALAIVSFSCTGPIVGYLLVQSAFNGGIAPMVGMLGFSLAIAIPFALFALFPSWLNTLPKSGGWLNSIKVFLGFLELALAFKFLSNADLVLQAHFLEREVFLAIWIAIFLGLVLYLFGKIKLPHDSPLDHISVGRLFTGLFVLAFVIYLIPGLWGAPLKWISGFTPPMNYSEAPYGVGYTKMASGVASTETTDFPEHAELGPHDILAFTDYEAGIAYAKEHNKPIFLDFTGYACINCRKMEERVWSEPQVLGKLKKDVVLISLYVDAKESLPEAEQYTSKTTGKRIRTIGNKWSDFQIKNYGANAQPYYVILNPENEEILATPVGYTPDVEEFSSWLEKGIDSYKK